MRYVVGSNKEGLRLTKRKEERKLYVAGETEWRQREEEEKLMKETEKCRTRLFWLLVEVQELKNKLTRSL